jgi:lysyl-tRNA synthetase class II
VTQLLVSCRLRRTPGTILVFLGHIVFLLPAHFRGNDPLESQSSEPSKNELKKRAKAAEKEKKAAEKAAKLAEQQREKAAAEEVRHLSPRTFCHPLNGLHPKREAKNDFAREFYGKLPLNQSQSRPGVLRHQIASLSSELDGKTVVIRARVHTLRPQGNKVFLKLRQRTDSVQALLSVEEGKVSKLMVKWAAGLSSENIVLVEGIVQKSPEEIKDATIKDVELVLTRVRIPAKVIFNGLC